MYIGTMGAVTEIGVELEGVFHLSFGAEVGVVLSPNFALAPPPNFVVDVVLLPHFNQREAGVVMPKSVGIIRLVTAALAFLLVVGLAFASFAFALLVVLVLVVKLLAGLVPPLAVALAFAAAAIAIALEAAGIISIATTGVC